MCVCAARKTLSVSARCAGNAQRACTLVYTSIAMHGAERRTRIAQCAVMDVARIILQC